MKIKGLKHVKKIIAVVLSVAVLISGGIIFVNAYDNTHRLISIETSNVINEDFDGIGVNVMPMSLMENNRSKGYNEAWFELEKSRIIKMQPKLIRLWTQVDWFVTDNDLGENATGEDYFNGIYDFESYKMQSVWAYMDVFKEIGAEVVLVTSWKVAETIQNWYPVDGINTPMSSAPGDIKAYAKAHAELFDYMINTKSYTNLSYFSVANEPNYGDFESHGDEYAYYMACCETLVNDIADKGLNIKCLGMDVGETTVSPRDWLYRALQDDKEFIDVYGFHYYNGRSDFENYLKQINSYSSGKPIYLTEFSSPTGQYWFDNSLSSDIVTAANFGVKGAMQWALNDIYLEYGDLDDTSVGGNTGIFFKPQEDSVPKDCYYESSLLMRYIPKSSDVVKTSVNKSDGMNVATFKCGDDYTVIIETQLTDVQSITLEFDKQIGKTFYKHVYTQDKTPKTVNATIPVSSGSFNATNSFKDTSVSNGGRCLVVYTTLPDAVQVEIDKPNSTLKAGSKVTLNATAIATAKQPVWEVAYGGGTVTENGVYTASGVASGDTVALKAYIPETDAYSIAIIKIT